MKPALRSLLFLLCLLAALAAFLALEIREKGVAIVQTDMQELLPADKKSSPAALEAVKIQQEQANREVLAVIGAENPQNAKRAASEIQNLLEKSSLFTSAQWQFGDKLAAVRETAALYGAYLLSRPDAALIETDPKTYAGRRAAEIANPFNYSLLPLSEDLLGFASGYNPPAAGKNLQPDGTDGSLTAQYAGKTWIFLRAQLKSGGLTATDARLPAVISKAEQAAAQQGAVMHTAAAALFNADGRASGSREGTRLSIIGSVLTVLLFIITFGRARILLLMLPALCGLAAGIAATVAVFGGIHLITLIIGTSLLGLLLDIPLHWLGKSLIGSNFSPKTAMQALRRPFFASTAVTIIGYVMLLAAPLTVLKQTAVYSASALAAAVAIAYLTLPALFTGFQPKPLVPAGKLLNGIETALSRLKRLPKLPVIIALAIITGAGLAKSQWQDDIADWVHLNPKLLNDIQEFSKITGSSAPAGFILVQAPDFSALIKRSAKASRALKDISETAAISDFLRTDAEQTRLKTALKTQTPADWQPLESAGIDEIAITAARNRVADSPNIAPEQALASPLGEPWQNLYLGELAGKPAAMIRLNGGEPAVITKAIAGLDGVQFISARAQISAGFNHTKHISLLLKLLSYLLAAGLLALIYGLRQTLAMLAIPLASVILTTAVMGLLGIRITAFAVFGLLLVMAIGVDYAIYAHSKTAANRARLAGMTLALATTLLTFGLLMFSSTPVVVSFGAAVTIGIALCALMAMLKMPLGIHQSHS